MGLFDARINYKPFEYPEVLKFTEAVNKTFWVHSEIDFTADVQDYHTALSPHERTAIKRSLLAIAQIEVAVKSFWGNLYQHMPKPELNGLGSTFAECEFRHSEAYSRLVEVLGHVDEFATVVEVPAIKARIQCLQDALKGAKALDDRRAYVRSLILFTLLVEGASLFSLFGIFVGLTRFRGLLKNVSNIIAWTSIDEQVHANAGIFLVNKIREEYPDLIDSAMEADILRVVHEAIDTERAILAWIFEAGEVDIVPATTLLAFMQSRVDNSLHAIGLPRQFHADASAMNWFDEEVFAGAMDDFFAKRPVEYTKHDKAFTADNLF